MFNIRELNLSCLNLVASSTFSRISVASHSRSETAKKDIRDLEEIREAGR